MNKRITVQDWANKHNTFVYTADMKPLGHVHCESPLEWIAYDANGTFIDRFTSKKDAINAI